MTARRPMKGLDPDQIRNAIRPFASQLPSAQGAGAAVILAEDAPPSEPVTVQDYAAAIEQLWSRAQQTFLDIGRLLDAAQANLPAEAYLHLCDELPFGKSARSQLLSAYRLVQSGGLPAGVERAGYATVYLVSALSEQERQQAVQEGIIHPDMQKKDIVAFRRRVRATDSIARPSSTDMQKRRELKNLLAEQARIAARIAELRQELGEEG